MATCRSRRDSFSSHSSDENGPNNNIAGGIREASFNSSVAPRPLLEPTPANDESCSTTRNCGDMANSSNTEMDRFLQQRRTDLMYELRNMEHSERPVTSQSRRENLQKFMQKHCTDTRSGSGKENIPSNIDSVEEHRPESIVVEVQGIIEQQRVSSVLRSAAFRRQLENVIRGSIRAPLSQPRAVNRARDHSTQQSNSPRAHSSASTPQESRDVSERLTESVQPRLERRDSWESDTSEQSFSSARSSIDVDDVDDFASGDYENIPGAFLPTPETSVGVVADEISPRPSTPARRASPQPPQQAPVVGNLSWNDITRVHREELVQEISELLHSRLVSSSLDGEFRATMELHIQDRLMSTGTNGEAVQEFVQNLPGRGIARNDFSDLGIIPPPDNDNWDNLSVTSVSAHSVPYIQTNTYLSKEIQSLKGQMKEMKSMLKRTFDLQLDIQRAVRQEVAAAMAHCAGACAMPSPAPSRPVNDTHCLICLEHHSDSVLYQCGHMCVCYLCGKDLVNRSLNCPVCRAPIKDVIRAYKTNMD